MLNKAQKYYPSKTPKVFSGELQCKHDRNVKPKLSLPFPFKKLLANFQRVLDPSRLVLEAQAFVKCQQFHVSATNIKSTSDLQFP